MSNSLLNVDTLEPYFSSNWKVAYGIAMAESHGDPNVTSHNPDGGTNIGLFQIDSKTAQAARLNVGKLKNPTYNIQAAAHLSNGGTNWRIWATAWDGKTYMGPHAPFRKYMKDAGFSTSQTGSTGDPVGDLLGLPAVKNPVPDIPGLGSLGDAVTAVPKFLGKLGVIFDGTFWLRVGQIAIGIAAIALGSIMIGKMYLPINVQLSK